MRHKALIVTLLAVSLCGCAGKMDAKRGLSEEWRLRSLEENFLNFKEGQRDQEERGRDQQRKLNDRLKAVEDSVQRIQEQLGAGGVPMPKKQAMAESAPPAASAPAAPAVVNAQPDAPQTEYAPSPAPASAEHAAPPAMTQPTPSSTPSATPSAASGSALYTEGMTLVAAEHSEEGRKLLQEFVSTEPNSLLIPNALYWIGESHYAEKNYPQAILAFKEVTRRYPKHHKSAAALLKIGMSYAMLGEKDNASLYLRALLQDFPKSEPAPLARKKLAELGR
ncbi:MAG: tol-pal system protein YbgF [Proteobacteria bacterium]|nr:tol-pal system protein YbgF [Pseudomonadota bacterium]